MLDVLVPKVGLQRPGVVPVIGQLGAAGMAQHVRMDLDRDLGLVAKANPDGYILLLMEPAAVLAKWMNKTVWATGRVSSATNGACRCGS
jgi:hypothetical protein